MKKELILLATGTLALAMLAADITLPPATKSGGMPLMDALANRKTSRDFAARELPAETLSSLLWAADGVNRPDGRRTAPTGLNVQDIDVYVMLASGVYLYDAKAHALRLVNAGDHRTTSGRQTYPHSAPVNLFYVQDLTRAMKADAVRTAKHGGLHAGAVMQNVYLFCAKEGLSCVARDYLDRDALAKSLLLKPTQRIVIGQTVGYAK